MPSLRKHLNPLREIQINTSASSAEKSKTTGGFPFLTLLIDPIFSIAGNPFWVGLLAFDEKIGRRIPEAELA